MAEPMDVKDFATLALDALKKEQDPTRKLAMEIFGFLAPRAGLDTSIILGGLCMALSTISVESGMTEEKAVYAFTKSFRHAHQRYKKLTT
jgi:hypothetical protein